MKWSKKACMAIGAAALMFTMVPAMHPVKAAVLVIDQQNIAEAIKTAINTATMLTNEQQQIALQIIDMASQSGTKLEDFLKLQTRHQDTIWDESGSKVGALGMGQSSGTFWDENYGSIGDILNGNVSSDTAYNGNQLVLHAIENTNQDALHNAKTTQEAAKSLSQILNTATQNSAEALGSKEAVQANTQAVGANTIATMYGNNLLSDMVATQTVKYQKEIRDEAVKIAETQAVNKKFSAAVAAQQDHSNDTTQDAAMAMYGPAFGGGYE